MSSALKSPAHVDGNRTLEEPPRIPLERHSPTSWIPNHRISSVAAQSFSKAHAGLQIQHLSVRYRAQAIVLLVTEVDERVKQFGLVTSHLERPFGWTTK
ncbi:hypothetical protein B0H15DRAFT_947148 [Mycena belliarum]|uniref:Uncharacterized protein n=1 Tax=Mycena belliarum TaxID=1033014 RepID=A0AAD6U8C2_9AGAR|nr:hypothetical protein B0H15DRAFT_957903 [Mycena belliae]KAJ7075755.1 hypothetical protein B0H15DRAFT_956252 [Mycena belliae]KAJ7094760.1 hypothetical protein B0H15DRAFT_947148 [Mycena belliae]